MTDIDIAPPAPPAPPLSHVTATLIQRRSAYTGPTEMVALHLGEEQVGIATVPRQAAYDLIHRLQDSPARLGNLTAELVGHVRYVLDSDHKDERDNPGPWLFSLIILMADAPDAHRRQLGLSYAAYTAAVTIATSEDGLAELRRLHETVLAAGARTATGG